MKMRQSLAQIEQEFRHEMQRDRQPQGAPAALGRAALA